MKPHHATALVLAALLTGACDKPQPAVSSPPKPPVRRAVESDAPVATEPALLVAAPDPKSDAMTQMREALRTYPTITDPIDRENLVEEIGDLSVTTASKLEIATTLAALFAQEKDTTVKIAIVQQLGEMNDPAAMPHLLGALSVKEPSGVREMAVEMLEYLDDDRVLPALTGLQNDPDPAISDAAKSAVESLSGLQ